MRALTFSQQLASLALEAISEYVAGHGVEVDSLCFVVVGSVGRGEALEASDLDLIPVARDVEALAAFTTHDRLLREHIEARVGIKVSRGADLTKAVSLKELTEPDCIGGSKDNSSTLTRRILILTEGRQVGGNLRLADVRRQILGAYANQNRTSGRHVLSFCNDVARYYNTLCIEYKAKIDDEEKDWCTRNIKLRHSRKFWYFSTIISIVKLSEELPLGGSEYVDGLLRILDLSPVERIVQALSETQPVEVGQLLESYSMFLEFMASPQNRAELARVEHTARYNMVTTNPFPTMKFNSDVLHRAMLGTIYALPASMRDRVIGWFLL